MTGRSTKRLLILCLLFLDSVGARLLMAQHEDDGGGSAPPAESMAPSEEPEVVPEVVPAVFTSTDWTTDAVVDDSEFPPDSVSPLGETPTEPIEVLSFPEPWTLSTAEIFDPATERDPPAGWTWSDPASGGEVGASSDLGGPPPMRPTDEPLEGSVQAELIPAGPSGETGGDTRVARTKDEIGRLEREVKQLYQKRGQQDASYRRRMADLYAKRADLARALDPVDYRRRMDAATAAAEDHARKVKHWGLTHRDEGSWPRYVCTDGTTAASNDFIRRMSPDRWWPRTVRSSQDIGPGTDVDQSFLEAGYTRVTDGTLMPGDVLIHNNHAQMYAPYPDGRPRFVAQEVPRGGATGVRGDSFKPWVYRFLR